MSHDVSDPRNHTRLSYQVVVKQNGNRYVVGHGDDFEQMHRVATAWKSSVIDLVEIQSHEIGPWRVEQIL